MATLLFPYLLKIIASCKSLHWRRQFDNTEVGLRHWPVNTPTETFHHINFYCYIPSTTDLWPWSLCWVENYNYTCHTRCAKSSMSCSMSMGLSIAAKWPPLSCVRWNTKFPCFKIALWKPGIISDVNQENPNGLMTYGKPGTASSDLLKIVR